MTAALLTIVIAGALVLLWCLLQANDLPHGRSDAEEAEERRADHEALKAWRANAERVRRDMRRRP